MDTESVNARMFLVLGMFEGKCVCEEVKRHFALQKVIAGVKKKKKKQRESE